MDELMMKKKELCIATLLQSDKWDKYWEGSRLRENQNIGVFSKNSITTMIGYGIHDRLNVLIGLPYISTAATQGQSTGVSGFQDISLNVKYKLYSTSSQNYLSDYMPFSLGLGTKEFSFRTILHYKLASEFYIRGSTAFLVRTSTNAERDFYYADGPFYTSEMDVPNALQEEISLGIWFFQKSLQVEGSIFNQTSLSGDDIRIQNPPQPTNKMEFTQWGVKARYFPSYVPGCTMFIFYNNVISGRNVGKTHSLGLGLTYQFKL
jgi:hypothetical protein